MDCHQEEIVRALMASYRERGGINHIDCGNLPSKKAVASICEDLLHLLFPGFFSEEAVASDDLEMLTKANFSYAMANAHPDIKKTARFLAKSNDENGVVEVLSEIAEG